MRFAREAAAARSAAIAAGRFVRARLAGRRTVTHKGAIDLVTEVDRASEERIVARIRRAFPRDAILTEERPELRGDPARRWIIDPLDGTTNYVHRYPFFCISVAFELRGRVAVGVVYDPMKGELFHARRGGGAWLGTRRIRTSATRRLRDALLASGFAYDVRRSGRNNLNHWADFTRRAQALRRDGAAALDLCYVACGRTDGFWELKLHPWDTAAGGLLVEEAGGRLTDFRGRPFRLEGEETLASNGPLHAAMVRVLAIGARGSRGRP